MIPSPILKVLSTLANHQVRCLLMGGQACVLYGAAEFSRDTDLNVFANPENLEYLTAALADLMATPIAVPPWDWSFLSRGHSLHFRCAHPDANNTRVDVMSVLRGVAPFEELWARRTTVQLEDSLEFDVMSLTDLVQAKKTRRDKDWPMIRRLIESHYAAHRGNPTPEQIEFWLKEARTSKLLAEIALAYPRIAKRLTPSRPLLSLLGTRDADAIAAALDAEEKRELGADRDYGTPLLKELEDVGVGESKTSLRPHG